MIVLVRYGEIHLKGLNRPFFEKLLKKNMESALAGIPGVTVHKGDGRFHVEGFDDSEYTNVADALSSVFGIHSFSPAVQAEKTMEDISKTTLSMTKKYLEDHGIENTTFKVITKRGDKRFPLNSMQICQELGGYLLDNCEGLTVDVHNPALEVHVEVREMAFCYMDVIPGQGGMPVGSSGKAMLLLSGGIDSPVAGYMTAKRGVQIEAVHYFSAPYTSEAAKKKVLDLAQILTRYTGTIHVHVVPFTEIQMEIYKHCPHEELVLIMRRFMMRIAQRIARERGALALVTGESIGQVASQTLESMCVTGEPVQMPVLRPLIGMDKVEIMERAATIGTYETSILPYEDCCTVFVPKHPLTKPKLEKILRSEGRLNVEELIEKAVQNIETVKISK